MPGCMNATANREPTMHRRIRSTSQALRPLLLASGLREIESNKLGELVMRELKRLDKVAYVRFASVYRSFEDVDEFRQLLRDI